jgi:hypothetical protein
MALSLLAEAARNTAIVERTGSNAAMPGNGIVTLNRLLVIAMPASPAQPESWINFPLKAEDAAL